MTMARDTYRSATGPSRPVAFVEAEVGTGGSGGPPVPEPFAAMRWGGVYRTIGAPDFIEPATWVAAKWVVPAIHSASPADDEFSVGFWIGLDGIDGSQIIQAGIQTVVRPDIAPGDGDAWTACAQWWTACDDSPALTVRNFPIAAGDTLSFTVSVAAPDLAHILMANLTQGIATTLEVSGPGCPSALGDYAPVVLDACDAASTTEILLLAGGADDQLFTETGGPSNHGTVHTRDLALIAIEAFA